MNELYSIPVQRADATRATLGEYRGKVLLLVNVASKCGLTPQYDALERLHKKYAGRGLQVLGFPANDFAAQEPGSDEEIQAFCRLNYGVTFPVFAKLTVKGSGQHALYAYLTKAFPRASREGSLLLKLGRRLVHRKNYTGETGEISWNFEKFLVDRKGAVVGRFAPDVKPESQLVVKAVQAELAKG